MNKLQISLIRKMCADMHKNVREGNFTKAEVLAATLAVDHIPELLDEVERLQADNASAQPDNAAKTGA